MVSEIFLQFDSGRPIFEARFPGLQRYIFGDVPVNYLVYLLLFGSNELDSDVKCQIFELVESYMYI